VTNFFHSLLRSRISSHLCFILLTLTGLPAAAQLGTSVDLPKPKKYENRKLASEKGSDKPLNPVAKFNQNLNTRYNFQFNAGNKLREVVENAKLGFRDDYRQLLSFYDYSLDQTAEQKRELDSVIHKCNNGILLHDLRNDWVDDLYLLMGKSYFFQKNFDSAAIAFQYINYAFQPRKKDEIGYDKSIGSNINTDGNIYTISTREKKNVVSSAIGHTPVRNESVLWLVRTFIEEGRYNESWSIMETLKRDRNFPERLQPMLEEMQAYWFYLNEQFDSAAIHLEKALGNAESTAQRARWEYLGAQLYEKSGKPGEADRLYDKAIVHTTDPVLEAYARISQIRLATGDEQERMKRNLEELLRMARKAKYEEYRHIIYFAAAQIELQRKNDSAATEYLRQSVYYNQTDPALKNSAFLIMAGLAWDRKAYQEAYNNYDSVDYTDPSIENAEMLSQRHDILGQLVSGLETVRVEDSLQRLARMPEADRNAYVKNLSKKLRKEKGLKEEVPSATGGAVNQTQDITGSKIIDIFERNTAKGEWYFYNTSLKSQGFRQFQTTWGGRPNVDNWRRLATVNAQQNTVIVKESVLNPKTAAVAANSKANPADLTFDGLMANIPLTAEAMELSQDSVEAALYAIGKIFKDRIGDCDETIATFETLLARFPQTSHQEEALFALSYCYAKAGNKVKADFYKGFLARSFSQSRYMTLLENPAKAEKDLNKFNEAATAKYEEIYQLFIEGNFKQALDQKKKADSLYGDHFWSPQLLYIESIYYVRQKQDSLAIATLNNLQNLYPNSPLTAKAATMADVLKRRREIEDYLTKLDVNRQKEDSLIIAEETPAPKEKAVVDAPPPPPVKEKEQVTKPEAKPKAAQPPALPLVALTTDSSRFKIPESGKKVSSYQFVPSDPHLVVLMLNKVDVVYVNEARQAISRYNREKYYNVPLEVRITALDENTKMVVISTFGNAPDALSYLEKTRQIAQAEIFPWLPADKYSFYLISVPNLELLSEQKNQELYIRFLRVNFPGKF
jgi:tetratricopeptide (TPR) repeat protein